MPVCFMIMPYGRKATQVEPGRGPAEIDFDLLYLGADDTSGPNYSGQDAVTSHYSEKKK